MIMNKIVHIKNGQVTEKGPSPSWSFLEKEREEEGGGGGGGLKPHKTQPQHNLQEFWELWVFFPSCFLFP